MQSDDFDLFQKEMQGVEPLANEEKVLLKQPADTSPGQQARRIAAVTEKRLDDNFLSSQEIQLLDPYEVLSFKRDGIQNGVFRKLKQGAYTVDSALDLHRMTVEEARVEVFNYIKESVKYGLRTVLVLHGKGDRNKDKPALLKSYTARWLPEIPEVMAYHSAVKRDGGVGALYVLLKKNETMKQDNRERHGLK